jgi:hypothetical protein
MTFTIFSSSTFHKHFVTIFLFINKVTPLFTLSMVAAWTLEFFIIRSIIKNVINKLMLMTGVLEALVARIRDPTEKASKPHLCIKWLNVLSTGYFSLGYYSSALRLYQHFFESLTKKRLVNFPLVENKHDNDV